MNISVFKPSIKRKEMDAVLTCMVSERIGFGQMAGQLVKDLSSFTGLRGGNAFKEYYRALSVAIKALELEEGSRVIVSALAPQMYSGVLEELGLVPVVVDVESESCCIDAAAVAKESAGASAVLLDYSHGFIPDLGVIMDTGLSVMEDISMAFGGRFDEKPLGSLGRITVINMDEDGIITTGGGAAVLAAGNRQLGALKNISDGLHTSVFLPDLNASLGIAQLNNIEQYLESRKEIADIFEKSVMRTRHKMLVQKHEGENISYSFPVLLETGAAEISAYARKKNIMTEAAFSGTIAAYSEDVQRACPNAKDLLLRCVNFPLYPMLGKKNISEISKVLSSLP